MLNVLIHVCKDFWNTHNVYIINICALIFDDENSKIRKREKLHIPEHIRIQ